MERAMVIQGRTITPTDIHLIKHLLGEHPSWNRTTVSRELCKTWQWLRADGRQLKDMACRTLLLKLEQKGHIELPPRQAPSVNGSRKSSSLAPPHRTEEICGPLSSLVPLTILSMAEGQ